MVQPQNVTADRAYAAAKMELTARLMQILTDSDDPHDIQGPVLF
ncbi:MAG: hypothetical protein OER86_04000 [Phycisphaerae bacterium]|nr:hypothetical protein [Phycisphaerae bacterium]